MVSGLYLDVMPYSVKNTSGREGGTQEGGREEERRKGGRKKEGREEGHRREGERKKEGREGRKKEKEGDSYCELHNFTRWTSAIRYQQLK